MLFKWKNVFWSDGLTLRAPQGYSLSWDFKERDFKWKTSATIKHKNHNFNFKFMTLVVVGSWSRVVVHMYINSIEYVSFHFHDYYQQIYQHQSRSTYYVCTPNWSDLNRIACWNWFWSHISSKLAWKHTEISIVHSIELPSPFSQDNWKIGG